MGYAPSLLACLRLSAKICKCADNPNISWPQGEITPGLVQLLANNLGLDCEFVEQETLERISLRPLRGPVILPLKSGQTLLFTGRVRDKPIAQVIDPSRNPPTQGSVSFEELTKHWTGEAILVGPRKIEEKEAEIVEETPSEEPKPLTPPKEHNFNLSFFFQEIKRMRKSMVEVGIAAIGLQIIGLATPLFFQIIIDKVVGYHSETTLHMLAIGMFGAILLEALFGWLRSYLLLFATSVIDLRLSIKTFERLSGLSLPFFERNPAGVLIKHMQQPEKVRSFLTGSVFGSLLDSFSLIIVLPILFLYSWKLTLLVLAFSGISALVIALAMGPFRKRLQDLYATEGERQAYLVENIRAMPTVKSLSLEPLRRTGWDNRTAVSTGMRFRVGKMGISINAFMQVMQKAMMLLTLWWGVYLVFDNSMTVGALVAFNMYSARVSGPLVQFASLIQQWQETAVSMQMLSNIMDEPLENGGEHGKEPEIKGALQGQGLSFRYIEDGPLALDNVSFAIPAGGVLGIVGRSGSGKSTLTRLIQRLLPLQQGHIWLDGYELTEIDMAHLRQSIGVVLQENFLFRGRVRDNIAMTKPTATLEEIVQVARMAAAHEFIEKLPDGYNTVLEEGGTNLSGGQRQRLAIARALLTNPKIMIFDEATSALDPESEAAIQDNIHNISTGRTMVIVSHRLSMLRHADCIMVLDHGKLVGMGRHEEVYANCAHYHQLWDIQNKVGEGQVGTPKLEAGNLKGQPA
ncbi:MAG: peptidase domain-containing ABC transporter [Desulfovibrionaceae bacterium]|nr:peptidase domain-containing ABC transporter [Desulfovibrionaceae bacterium]